MENMYLCIDLKSFYASVECVERGLDPMTTNLVVADSERSDKTICLAITPAMKALGVKNRCRVFQIPKSVKYIMAPPRMQLYIDYSANIYEIYLEYASKDDIHVYSVDEAFIDVTRYLSLYNMTAKELAVKIMSEVKEKTGITATAGIGTNLYLAKVALDIMAKRDKENIGYLDEEAYQKTLWTHKPLTDFWRVGPGTVKRLASIGVFTMGDIARADEKVLYKLFGVDAELLIDHAWGRESTTMEDIKAYRPKNNSLSNGQVLMRDYTFEECELIVKEMTDALCLEMTAKGMVTSSISLMVGYSNVYDMLPATGSVTMSVATNSYNTIVPYVLKLYHRIVEKDKLLRRLSISCNGVECEEYRQLDFFTDYSVMERDKKLQSAALDIKRKYGKNALVRGMDLQEWATTMDRNRQIGGHKSGE